VRLLGMSFDVDTPDDVARMRRMSLGRLAS
jgi:hypothetical protein